MQPTTALSFYLLAMAGPASILAQDVVTVWDSATTIVTVTAGAGASPPPQNPPANNNPPENEKIADPAPAPSPSSAPASSPPPAASSAPASGGGGSSGPSGNLQSSGGKICVNFSGNDNFHFLNTGSWGSNSGSGTQSASQCFEPSANAGMFICESECQDAGDAASAKYTKLECTLGGEWQNCDISLVDGFSLPLKCTISGASPAPYVGGTEDLGSCPSPGQDNTCLNANSYQGAETDVAQYFQNADQYQPNSQSGPNYCVFQTCSKYSDVFFSGTPTIECEVGYRSGSSSKRNEGSALDIPADVSKREAGAAHRAHGHRHSHAHAHARGLKDVVA